MIDFVYVPVPADRVIDVFRLLYQGSGTPESGALGEIEHATTPIPALVARRGRPPGRKSKYQYPCSPEKLERAKSVVKRLNQPFAKVDLQRAIRSSAPTTSGTLERMVEQGWLEDMGYGRRGSAKVHWYRYLPAPETPQPKRKDDPPEVTGRGKVKANGSAPVPGTGRRDILRGEMGQLVTRLRKQGWTVERSGGDHFKASHRGMARGTTVTIPSTPSDPRSILNVRAELRRYGANI